MMKHLNVPGFNIIGHVSANLGIAVTACNIVQLVLDRGFQVAILDVDPGLGRHGHDQRFAQYTVDSADQLPYGINLVVIDIGMVPELFLDLKILGVGDDRINVGFIMWELTVLPDVWKKALELFDVVIATTTFIHGAYETNLENVAVIPALHPVFLPAGIEPARARFGLPEGTVLFVFSFETNSDPQRKNPFAVVEAFERAFGLDGMAHLVLKLNNSKAGGVTHPIVAELAQRCASLGVRVHIIDQALSYLDVLSLYASCDVFVSLHRSEGLGLGLMEMMSLGKPVIATGWSGNMTFMDYTNSCPVSYRLIPAEGSIPSYQRKFLGKDAFWADPSVEEAAAWMRRLANDPALRAEIGAKGKKSIEAFHRTALEGHFLEEVIAIWNNRAFLPSRLDEKRRAFRELVKVNVEHRRSLMSPAERIASKVKGWLDRQVLWRLKSREGRL